MCTLIILNLLLLIILHTHGLLNYGFTTGTPGDLIAAVNVGSSSHLSVVKYSNGTNQLYKLDIYNTSTNVSIALGNSTLPIKFIR